MKQSILITFFWFVLLAPLQAQTISPPLPSRLTFAGEDVDLTSFDIRERLEQELATNMYQQSLMLLKLKRANRWFAVMEPILKEQGVPDDFKYLAVAESALEENAESATGAAGFWQFMDSTAVQYGLENRREGGRPMVDERYDVAKSTLAACKYLKALKEKHGSWLHAVVAYNWGSRNLSETMKAQGASSFFEMNSGSEEVMRYVFRVIAHKVIMETPRAYGFDLKKDELYGPLPATRTVNVTATVPSLGAWAVSQGTTYRMLKVHNPWLRAASLTVPAGRSYAVRVPEG